MAKAIFMSACACAALTACADTRRITERPYATTEQLASELSLDELVADARKWLERAASDRYSFFRLDLLQRSVAAYTAAINQRPCDVTIMEERSHVNSFIGTELSILRRNVQSRQFSERAALDARAALAGYDALNDAGQLRGDQNYHQISQSLSPIARYLDVNPGVTDLPEHAAMRRCADETWHRHRAARAEAERQRASRAEADRAAAAARQAREAAERRAQEDRARAQQHFRTF